MKKIIIAIDGPAGAGKSTVARKIAEKMGLLYVDTGAMYRAFGLKCIRNNLDPRDEKAVNDILITTSIDLIQTETSLRVLMDGEDVSKEIRTQKAGKAASIFSALPEVRKKMIEIQRSFGKKGGIIMEGRDIGTVVFPNADIKVYLDASPETRAKRRYKDLYGEDMKPDMNSPEFRKLLEEQLERDRLDQSRGESPLKPASDSITLDSTGKTQEEVIKMIVSLSERHMRSKKRIE